MNTISALEIIRIEEIFKSNNWEVEADKEIKVSLFNRFLDRYRRIDIKHRDYFLELAKIFLRITDKEIYKRFKDSYDLIYDDFLNEFDKIYFLPLVKPYIDINEFNGKVSRPKVKSGEKIRVFIEASEYRDLKFSSKIEFLDNFQQIEKCFKTENDLLVLIDDFVGTGDTALEVIYEIFSHSSFNNKNVILISLVAMRFGIDNIYEKSGVLTFTKLVKKKAISESNLEEELKEENKLLMKEMAKKIKCPKKYALGYKDSEALVSILNKSPNNTFGVFWHETSEIIAPFPRYINFK